MAIKSKYYNIQQLSKDYRYDEERDEIFSVVGTGSEQNLSQTRKMFSQAPVQKGVFTNKTTGATSDRYGNPVNYDQATGRVSSIPPEAAPMPEKSLDERAKSSVAGRQVEQYEVGQQFEKDFGIKNPFESTLEAEYRKYEEEKQAQTDYLKGQNQIAEEVQQGELSQFRSDAESGVEGVKATLLQGREGVVSATRPEAVGKYETAVKGRIDRAIKQAESARMARQNAEEALKRAQEVGDEALIRAYSGAVENAKLEITRAETDLLAEQSRSAQLALDLQDQTLKSLGTFQGMIESGAEFGTEGLIGMAQSLNLPFETVYSYYQSAENIRNEKGLDLTEKAAKLDELNMKLEREARGVTNATLENVDYLESLYRSGASAEEISRTKQALKIPDELDPMYQAELRVKNAEAKIKEDISNGILTNPLDILNHAKELAILQELQGGGGVYVPNGSKYEVATVANGIRINVSDGQKLDRGWCGQFVNDVLGIGVGDTLASKMNFVDESIVVPSAGMAFVTGRGYDLGAGKGNSGHIGIVESVNADGTFNTVEANYNGDANPQNGKDGSITRRRNVPVTEALGFIRPPNAEIIGGGAQTTDSLYQSSYNQALQDGVPKKEAEAFAKQQYADSFKPMTEAQGKAYNAFVIMNGENETYSEIVNEVGIDKLSKEINFINRELKEGDSLTADLIRENITDSEVASAINSEVRWLEAALREESGAVITVEEYRQKGPSYFPRPGDSEKEIERKAKLRETVTKAKEGKMGPSAQRIYKEAFGQDEKVNKYEQLYKNILEDEFTNKAVGLDDETMAEINSIW